MPSGVLVGGTFTRVPGVYSEVDTSRLSGRSIDLNILGVVAELPFLEQGKPVRVGTASALKGLAPNNPTVLRIASLVYKASGDDRIEGAPTAVVVCSPVPTTQAILTLTALAAPAMVIKSTAWGPEGNKTLVEYDTSDSTKMVLKVSRNGVSETHSVLREVAFTVVYSGTEANDMVLNNSPDDGFVITATKNAIHIGSYYPDEMAFDGKLYFTLNAPPGVGETTTISVQGIRKDTGALYTENVVIADTDDTGETSFEYSQVTEIEMSTTGATGTFDLLVDAFNLQVDEYATASDIADRINAFVAQKFTAVKISAKIAKIPTDELELIATDKSIKGTAFDVPADFWALLKKLEESSLITAEKASGSPTPGLAPDTSTVQYLAGGTATTPDGAAWDKAEAAMRIPSVQILWVGSDEESVHATFDSHCKYMAGKGANERNLWVGPPANTTKTNLFTKTGALNSRHTAFVPQEALADDWDGRRVWLAPMWYALMHAAMQAGTRPGVALTRKRPRIYGIRQSNTWDPKADEEELLQRGLCVTQEDQIGFRVLRSITTYQEDDNRAKSEVSTNESVNTSVRDLREELDFLVGDTEATAGQVLTLAKAVLRTQVTRKLIKWFDEESVEVTDAGDVFVVRYEFAPIEPKNFIIVQASAVTQIVVAAA